MANFIFVRAECPKGLVQTYIILTIYKKWTRLFGHTWPINCKKSEGKRQNDRSVFLSVSKKKDREK